MIAVSTYRIKNKLEVFYFFYFILVLSKFIKSGTNRIYRLALLREWLQRIVIVFFKFLKKRDLNYFYNQKRLCSLFDFEGTRRRFIRREQKKNLKEKFGWNEFLPLKQSYGFFYHFFQFKRRTAIRDSSKKQYAREQSALYNNYSGITSVGGFPIRRYTRNRAWKNLRPVIHIFIARTKQFFTFLRKYDRDTTSVYRLGLNYFFERVLMREQLQFSSLQQVVKDFFKSNLVIKDNFLKKKLFNLSSAMTIRQKRRRIKLRELTPTNQYCIKRHELNFSRFQVIKHYCPFPLRRKWRQLLFSNRVCLQYQISLFLGIGLPIGEGLFIVKFITGLVSTLFRIMFLNEYNQKVVNYSILRRRIINLLYRQLIIRRKFKMYYFRCHFDCFMQRLIRRGVNKKNFSVKLPLVRNIYRITCVSNARNFYLALNTKRSGGQLLFRTSSGLIGGKKKVKKKFRYIRKAVYFLLQFLLFLDGRRSRWARNRIGKKKADMEVLNLKAPKLVFKIAANRLSYRRNEINIVRLLRKRNQKPFIQFFFNALDLRKLDVIKRRLFEPLIRFNQKKLRYGCYLRKFLRVYVCRCFDVHVYKYLRNLKSIKSSPIRAKFFLKTLNFLYNLKISKKTKTTNELERWFRINGRLFIGFKFKVFNNLKGFKNSQNLINLKRVLKRYYSRRKWWQVRKLFWYRKSFYYSRYRRQKKNYINYGGLSSQRIYKIFKSVITNRGFWFKPPEFNRFGKLMRYGLKWSMKSRFAIGWWRYQNHRRFKKNIKSLKSKGRIVRVVDRRI